MNAVLVIKSRNGYAVAAYAGEIPADFVQNMTVAAELLSYSYSKDTVLAALKEHFEPPEPKDNVAPLKDAA